MFYIFHHLTTSLHLSLLNFNLQMSTLNPGHNNWTLSKCASSVIQIKGSYAAACSLNIPFISDIIQHLMPAIHAPFMPQFIHTL